MIAAAKRNNKKLAVAHVQRFNPAIQLVKKFYDSGELGKLCMYTENRTVNYLSYPGILLLAFLVGKLLF